MCRLHHDMCVRVWLEVGHVCEPRRSPYGRALALDWRIWVRGVSGHDISAFVHKVVFHLHPATAFVYPKRVLQEPPYEIQESGCSSIDIPIHVYLKYSSNPKKIRIRYSLQIENSTKSSSESRCIYYDFENPSEQLCRALMEGGGEVVPHTGAGAMKPARGKRLLVVLSDSDERRYLHPQRRNHAKKYKFIEPIQCMHGSKKKPKSYVIEEICSKCGESTTVEMKKQLRAVNMSEDDINRVSQLYLAYTAYEKSVDALILPPFSDPIYRVPELPLSLREALKGVEMNRAMLL
ncbi:hypothetical protein K1T71_009187 [Dendrolimus kikuchii]|uniref:Uncharacterized protein n=1 Tax=Dendrolimus kikuchii TaxID=765133 RepID=A0ACC1CTY2_9NEOP|nr:hypothetical protein K1T71_009187 [Dendrolimus kikuchii]